jgi:mono/diheme cytochrome c family protein
MIMKRILLGILAVLVLFIAGLVIFVFVTWNKTYDVRFPDIKASSDSSVIARGKYLAYGMAHCSYCHVPMDKIMEVEKGSKIPLSGGWELKIPPGTFRAPNLTPDKETGIGNFSDGQLARAMRFSVNHKGKFLAPFMPFQELSDDDLTAIISFLRSQEPVKQEVKPSSISFLGKALLAFGVLEPIGPKNTPPKSVKIDSSVEYGSYLANSVGDCIGCHTKRDLKSGEFTGPAFAGGGIFEPESFTNGYAFISPNITPDKETGVLANWNEETFIKRFRAGRVYEYSPMPWGAFSRLADLELKALYRYLQSLEPVNNKIEKTVFEPGEDLP